MGSINQNKTFFITGASGFIGQKCLEHLSEEFPQSDIKILVHKSYPTFMTQNIKKVSGSLNDMGTLKEALADVDTIIHLAAIPYAEKMEDYFEVNVQGTKCLLEAAKGSKVKSIIFISSRCIQSDCGAYAISKMKAEEILKDSKIPYVILRLSEVCGPQSDRGIRILIKLVKKFPIVFYPGRVSLFSPVFLDDVVTAIVNVVKKENLVNKTYTVAGPKSYTMSEILKIIAKALGLKRVIIPLPLALLKPLFLLSKLIGLKIASDQVDRLLCKKDDNSDDAKKELDFKPRFFEDFIGEIIKNGNSI